MIYIFFSSSVKIQNISLQPAFTLKVPWERFESGNESTGAFHLEDVSRHPAPCTESADCILADAQAESCCSGAFSLGNSWATLMAPVGPELQEGTPPCSFTRHGASPGAAPGHPGDRSPAALLSPVLAAEVQNNTKWVKALGDREITQE